MRMKWSEAFKIAIFSSFISMLIFLMIDVFASQTIKDFVLANIDSNIWTLLILIIGGFILGLIISLISGILSSDLISKKYVFGASLLAFIINFLIWVIIAYISIEIKYDILDALSFIEKIIVFPRILAYFSIYVLSNVTLLWLVGQITYCVLYAIFLKIFGANKARKGKYNYNLRM